MYWCEKQFSSLDSKNDMEGLVECKNGTKLSNTPDFNCAPSGNIHESEKVQYIKMGIINSNKNDSNSIILVKRFY